MKTLIVSDDRIYELIVKCKIRNIGGVESISDGTLSFAENGTFFLKAISNCNIDFLITTSELLLKMSAFIKRDICFFVSRKPRIDFWRMHNKFGYLFREHILPFICLDYRGSNVKVHPTAFIEDGVYLGDNVEIGANSVIKTNSYIGDNSFIGNGVVIGANGLEVVYDRDKKIMIRRYGGVRIDENVHIMDNSIVSQAVWGFTEICANVTISVLCNIAASSVIGKNTRMSGNCLIGGSSKLGENVIIGPSVTIKDGLKIGSNSRIRIGSVVVKNCPANSDISGNFALDHIKNLRRFAGVQCGWN